MTGGQSIAFTRKAVDDFYSEINLWKSNVVVEASQLCQYSICQKMPAGFQKFWNFVTEINRFLSWQQKSRRFESIAMSFLQSPRPEFSKIESFHTTGRQNTLTASAWRVLITLQPNVWGNGLLLSSFFLSGTTPRFQWQNYPTWLYIEMAWGFDWELFARENL